MNNSLTDLVTYSFLAASIFVLTKPGGNGPGLVKALTNGYAGIVQSATGQKVSPGG